MRPFSAFTYFRNNRLRVLVLILMMSFITVCFIGGMYVDNPGEIFRITLEGENRFLVLDTRGTSNDSIEQYRELQGKLSSYLPEDISTIIYLNRYYEDFDSIMGFNCTTDHYIFQSAEDFELFKTRTGLVPEDVHLKNGETVMSEQLANNQGVHVGENLPKRKGLTLVATMKVPGMRAYSVYDMSGTNAMMIVGNDANFTVEKSREFADAAKKIVSDYPLVWTQTYSTDLEETEFELSFMYYIFFAIVIVVVIVLLVTINAAFTAAYDKRKHEFAIYKALGFTKFQIFRKIASEVLLMNLFAIVIGACINAGLVLVLNQVLWSSGQYFPRVSKLALIGTVLAEMLIVVTIIFLNWKKVRKCEVTED